MSMPLTAAQVDQLQQHFDSRNFVAAYELLELWTRDSTDQDMQVANTWFLGAGDINRGEGPFADLALAFNQRQGLLRGYPVSIDDNQGASDHIAERVINLR